MTPRERVLTALNHREPDRVPFNMRICPELLAQFRQRLGDPLADWSTTQGHDIRPLDGFAPEPCPDGVAVEEWTPPVAADQIDAAARQVRALQAQDVAVCSGYQMGVFEHAKEWLGDVDTLTLPHLDPRRCERVLDRITGWKMAVYGAWVSTGVDVVWIGDDLGTQRSLVMSPADYRHWYRPRHQRLVAHLKGLNPQVRVAFHCCGHVAPLVRDLIDIGVDILEAVQAEAMDIGYLKHEFGRDLCFWGGVGAQSVLARPSRQQVIDGVRQTLAKMMPGGGYIAAPCHTLTEEVTWDNIEAYHEAVRQYGSYAQAG